MFIDIKQFNIAIFNQIKRLYYLIPPTLRPGPYGKTFNFIENSEYWNKDDHIQYQTIQMRKLIAHAYQNVKYYRKLFESNRLKPSDFLSLNDLQKLPFLTKEIVRNNINDLKADNYKRYNFRQSTTGGSSGEPLFFFEQRFHSEIKELAFVHKLWERIGFHPGAKRAVLRGPVTDSKEKLRYDRITKQLLLSSYHTDDYHLHKFYNEIARRNIRFLHAHISAAATFANFLVKNNLKLPLKAVLGASENVFPMHRELIENAFGTRLFSFYGQSEHVVMAGECEHSSAYHIFPQYGITELIDENGNNIHQNGQIGEIVGTGFNNYAMPFIRYKTGDMAEFFNGDCPCGRKYDTFKTIQGRSNEYIYTSDDRKITTTGLIYGRHLRAYKKIEKIQVYQDTVGIIEIRIVKKPEYRKQDELEISSAIEKAVTKGLKIKFSYVDDIPLTNRGKHKFILQMLSSMQ